MRTRKNGENRLELTAIVSYRASYTLLKRYLNQLPKEQSGLPRPSGRREAREEGLSNVSSVSRPDRATGPP